ncbi:MAG: G-D-S-L family lipolytic protein [Bacteroidetes bacterium 4572_77]|nr:MAG: G-D-S-L family lipolytic protein [Bacteroidetes bacterium 4572_77]
MKLKYIIIALLPLIIFSCKPEMKDGFVPSNGEADFSKYVALGNSLTAGYADGALYHSAQEVSYPNILSGVLSQVGGGEFIQPVVTSEQGILAGKLKLALVNGSLTPVPAEDGELEPFFPPIGYAVNNLGVPGAKVGHLLAAGYGNIENMAAGLANPYFVRFASSPNISVIEQALSMSPTFFSLWIGNNDVLGYASTGGVGDVITPVSEFATYYGALCQMINTSGAKGVLANIPDVTSAAYFITVPGDALEIDITQATMLNLGLSQVETKVNEILAMAGLGAYSYGIHFESGKNGFLIEDNEFPYSALFDAIADTSTDAATVLFLNQAQFRQIDLAAGELLTLKTPQDSLALGMGSFYEFAPGVLLPYGIPNVYVLDQQELALVEEATQSYNDIIKNTAQEYDWAWVDINTKVNETKDGVVYNGIKLDNEYVTGGVFGLDGVHLTPRGNALVADFFIEAINKKYNSKISSVDVNLYPGVALP